MHKSIALCLLVFFAANALEIVSKKEKKEKKTERLETNILNLILVEVRYPVNDDPRKSSSKVYHLVHHKGHDASGESIVLHIEIPGCP